MKSGQAETPFFAAVKEYARRGLYPFHTPAHKQGRSGDAEILAALGRSLALDIDPPVIPLPECGAETDERVQAPSEAIRAAEDLTARLFGADRTFFLVNGATQGIQAMLLALTSQGEKVLIPRHSHRSVAAGLALAGSEPIFMPAKVDRTWGIPRAISPAGVESALSETNAPRPVHGLVTSPNYWGLAEDIAGLSDVLAARGGLVLCDEAHGAHLPFVPGAPRPALADGAAVSVQSAHKMLGSLVQSSWLHVKGDGALQDRLASAIRLLSTASPSFLLLSSLDATRRWSAEHGPVAFATATREALGLRGEVNALDGLECLGEAEAARLGYMGIDPFKLTFRSTVSGLDGLAIAKYLRDECRLQVEIADPLCVTLVLSPADTSAEYSTLVEALTALLRRPVSGGQGEGERIGRLLAAWPDRLPARASTIREAYLGRRRRSSLRAAVGETAADIVAPYPPGIPVLYPGDLISVETAEYLDALAHHGMQIDGLAGSPSDGFSLEVVG